jgi:Ligated ion channel L-glutamate- and glycine-binding site
MEKIILSLIIMLSLISSGSGYNNWQLIDDNLNGISHATARVISDICGETKKLSMLIFHEKHFSNSTFMHEVNHILFESSRDFKISLRITTSSNNASFRAKCNVIITSSCDEFIALYDDAFIARLDNEHSPLLIVLLGTSDSHKIVTIFDYLWNASVYNVNVMLKESDSNISILTYFPFQGHHCSDTTPTLINEFRNGDFINSTENFFPSKMDDLQKCPIRVATSNNSDPYIFTSINANGSVELYGRDITILDALAGSLNFQVDYVFVGREGVLLENGTAEGAYKRLLDGRADIAIADMWLKANRLKFIDATNSYIRQQIAFVIPPGAELTSFEKYLRPMDTWTWTLTIATMVVAFLVIFIVKRKSIYIQNLIFGEKVQDPYMNVLVGLFGGSQTTLPHQNFPRFILMMFLMFCLIMRTLYQGSLYRFLQTKIYHKEVQSIDEMIERDYKFYVVPSILDLIEGHPRIYERLVKG